VPHGARIGVSCCALNRVHRIHVTESRPAWHAAGDAGAWPPL